MKAQANGRIGHHEQRIFDQPEETHENPALEPWIRSWPDRKHSQHGERHAPWRTVATWYLWRSLDPAVVQY